MYFSITLCFELNFLLRKFIIYFSSSTVDNVNNMKIYSILYSLLTVASALPTSLFFADKKRHRLFKELDEKRLIIDRENKQRWISSVELKEMQSKCIPFMDITSFQYLSENVTKHQPSFPTQLYAGDVMKPFFSLISQKSMKSTMQTFTSFYNRHYRSQHGVDSTRWLLESVQELILEYRADQYVSISEFSHSSSKDLNGWTQPSLIARMERKESDTPDDVIIISAHLDSTAGMFGSAFKKAPGADDNGKIFLISSIRINDSFGSIKSSPCRSVSTDHQIHRIPLVRS